MASGRINLQANDGKVAGIMFEDGASSNVTVTVPKEGGVVATEAYADTKVSKTGDETIAGVKTFSSSPIVPVPTLANQVISMGNIIEKTGAGIGYGAGSGGTVTQATSKSTAVTLNKPCGLITMHNSTLAAGATVQFLLYNTLAGIGSNIVANPQGTDNYSVEVRSVFNNGCSINVTNKTGGSLSEALQIQFALIKGATA